MELLALSEDLKTHLIVELGEHGYRVVEFLDTAKGLLDQADFPGQPRLSEAVAYSLREALKAITNSQDHLLGAPFRTVSRQVVTAALVFERSRGIPNQDETGALDALLSSVRDLESIHHEQGVHARRLESLIVERTGTSPLDGGNDVVTDFQRIVSDLDEGVHGRVDSDSARRFWNRSVLIAERLFTPPEIRNAQLSNLAGISAPNLDDVAALEPLLVGPHHLVFFLSQLDGVDWLIALADSSVLEPQEDRGWPGFAAVERLREIDPAGVLRWLMILDRRFAENPAKCWFVGRAALDVGGIGLITEILGRHPGDARIAALGSAAADQTEPESSYIDLLADQLLNPTCWEVDSYQSPLLKRFISGLNQDNSLRRLQLLVWKLKDEDAPLSIRINQSGTVDQLVNLDDSERSAALSAAAIQTAAVCLKWNDISEVLRTIEPLPPDFKARLRSCLLATGPVLPESAVSEIEAAITSRYPVGDDVALIELIERGGSLAEAHGTWHKALGPPPLVDKVRSDLITDTLPEEVARANSWIGLVPKSASRQWSEVSDLVAARFGRPSRSELVRRPSPMSGWGQSPISSADLENQSPLEAASVVSKWRPDPTRPMEGTIELARTLESVVKADSDAWSNDPSSLVKVLRHPTYISHYLQALAEAGKERALPVLPLLDAVTLVWSEPWPVERIAVRDFDHDPNWSTTKRAALDVIRVLANADADFDDRSGQVWGLVESAVRGSSAPSTLTEPRDPLQSAINRDCTRALDTALTLMAARARREAPPRTESLSLIEDSLRIEGDSGAEHRAIIASRLGLLRFIDLEWFDQLDDLFFGNRAPEGLAQETVDLALKWSRPAVFLLERHRPLVLDAVRRSADNAMEHFLIGMLWGLLGYQPKLTFKALEGNDEDVSTAGETLGRVLRHGASAPEQVLRATEFWQLAIEAGRPSALKGFGWMAEVGDLDQDRWLSLTLATVRVTRGAIDWSQKVVERLIALPPSEDALSTMDLLVRGTGPAWARRGTSSEAVELLENSSLLSGTGPYLRLQTALVERNAILEA